MQDSAVRKIVTAVDFLPQFWRLSAKLTNERGLGSTPALATFAHLGVEFQRPVIWWTGVYGIF